MEIGKEESNSNVQNAQCRNYMEKTQEPPHKKVLLTENMQYSRPSASMPTGYRGWNRRGATA